VVFIYNGVLFSFKKEENPDICEIGMNVEDIMPSEMSQAQQIQILHNLTHMWNLKSQTLRSGG
jgi:hypothetical protein